ncbi:hypothetical protein HEK616_10320 [Streptomyces nigrescens]|uniref:Uncharacterized protein n=1 Tax=Streptomyces nigrescens TaxID=1920 RepID=A0ABM7ZMK5_STRNI|nr:hypothetical protein [Streptomyces nigrescens]BDM67545.1 hypothetical protein HEK616_10320 [Streptomyces nigrescens]
MFTIKARHLAATLDRVAPHRYQADDDAHDLDVLVLDCTPGHLHAVGCSDRTLAVARTSVTGDVWTAPVGYDDAAALRGWLESSEIVTVEHVTSGGHQQLRFTEGPAQITVPAASHTGRLPWRALLRLALDARDHPLAVGRPVQLNADDLALWGNAGVDGEAIEFRSLGPVGTMVTAGPDFLGLQTPHTWDGPTPGKGWSSSLRTRLFLFAGAFLEVGGRYADAAGMAWVVPARPGPGEEPTLVSADYAAVTLPISQVLAGGKFLIRLPD